MTLAFSVSPGMPEEEDDWMTHCLRLSNKDEKLGREFYYNIKNILVNL